MVTKKSFGEMLEGLKELFPKDIPHGLPPIRGIKHHIDFILGATLPNRTTYRENPEESKKKIQQVGKLVEKGWVRDNLRSGYYQIRMKEGNRWRTIFKTKLGLYEWLVMSFVLTSKYIQEAHELCVKESHRQICGYIVNSKGVKVDEKKVKVIQSWPTPQSGLYEKKAKKGKKEFSKL
ncbi:hypothetical protein CR513_42566, partial [Mucuna pruriens]